MSELPYVGKELEIFEHAVNWKAYFCRRLAPYIRGRVLEVGAGLGANTRVFADLKFDTWTCLEPDPTLFLQLGQNVPNSAVYNNIPGTLAEIPAGREFDTILYVDVLEHIEDDTAEMERASAHLAPGGRVIVLSPAHQWLFSPFDAAIGHFRRYTTRTLAAVSPPDLKMEALFYMDSVGMAASLANRVLLKKNMPTLKQIKTWDQFIVPVSRVVDPLLGWRLGKSVIGIWQRSAS